jgi:phi13 family phage major tail protein
MGTTKKALKGLREINLFPIVANTSTAYSVGEKLNLIGAQQLSKDDQVEEYVVYADDDVYDSGTEYKYTDLTLTLAELDLAHEAQLTGGLYESSSGIYSARTTYEAPEYALAYAALFKGGYRLFRHYVVKLMSVKVDHSTKGENNEIAPYTLTFRIFARKIDGNHKDIKDVTLSTGFTWIQTIEAQPVSGGG